MTGPIQARGRIRRRATAVLRTRLDEFTCLGMAERNDAGSKGDQCHDSRCRSWKHEIHENRTRGSFLGYPGRATTHSGFQPRFDIRYAIDGDVDGYFCPGSGGGTYPH